MAKLGSALPALLVLAVLGLAARPANDDAGKLDEIKALLTESLRIQKAEVHRRLFPNHRVGSRCDYDERCAGLDGLAKAHNRAYSHTWTEDCGAGKCAAKEEAYQKSLKDQR
jgi:hypothetical protein